MEDYSLKVEAYIIYFEFLTAIFQVELTENFFENNQFYDYKEKLVEFSKKIFLLIVEPIQVILSLDFKRPTNRVAKKVSLLLLVSMCPRIRRLIYENFSTKWALIAPPREGLENETILLALALLQTHKYKNVVEGVLDVYKLFDLRNIKPRTIPILIDVFREYIMNNHIISTPMRNKFFKRKRLIRELIQHALDSSFQEYQKMIIDFLTDIFTDPKLRIVKYEQSSLKQERPIFEILTEFSGNPLIDDLILKILTSHPDMIKLFLSGLDYNTSASLYEKIMRLPIKLYISDNMKLERMKILIDELFLMKKEHYDFLFRANKHTPFIPIILNRFIQFLERHNFFFRKIRSQQFIDYFIEFRKQFLVAAKEFLPFNETILLKELKGNLWNPDLIISSLDLYHTLFNIVSIFI